MKSNHSFKTTKMQVRRNFILLQISLMPSLMQTGRFLCLLLLATGNILLLLRYMKKLKYYIHIELRQGKIFESPSRSIGSFPEMGSWSSESGRGEEKDYKEPHWKR